MTAEARDSTVALDALRRAIRRPPPAGDTELRCQLCNLALPRRHRHLLDEELGEPMCACQACTLLFEREAASRGHYRLIPDRRRRLPAFSTKELGVPVGLAFFVQQSDGAVIANYPSPLGATQWEVDADAWQAVQRQCPDVTDLTAAVEAVLVNTARGAAEHWMVPIDECFRLVAVIRTEWRGLSGGTEVWPAIDEFFTELGGQHGRSYHN